MSCRIALCLGVVLGLACSAEAQAVRGQPPPRVIQFIPVNVEGKVVEVRPGVIAVATADKGAWRVGVADNTVVSVAGTALPDVLRPGLYIRFLAAVDKSQGRVPDKVAKLTIFTPTTDDARTVGVFLPGQCRPVVSFLEDAAAAPPAKAAGAAAAAPAKAAEDAPTPPAKAAEPAANDPTAAAAKKPTNQAGENPVAPAVVKDGYDIHGQISGGKGHRLTIKVPNKLFKSTLNIELSPEPVIELDLVNYLMAKPGDKVQARGLQLGPNNLQATELLITLADPLGKTRKKPPKLTAK